jgi:hypothetical protein
MDAGVPMSLESSAGTLTFNDLEGDVLGDGNGYLVQAVNDGDYPSVRNPVDNRSMRDGGIVHPFHKGAFTIRIGGLIVAVDPITRQSLDDRIRGYTDPLLREDGLFTWEPRDAGVRVRTVRLYSAVEISGESTTGGMLAGPKMFEFTLVAGDTGEV